MAPVVTALDGYDAGQASIEAVQSAAETAANALDNAHGELVEALGDAERELESVRFTMSPDNQRTAVLRIGASLRRAIAAS